MEKYSFDIAAHHLRAAHLTPIEDLTLRRLIDAYFLREQPLPADSDAVARLVRLVEHKSVVDAVLREFFSLCEDGWRCQWIDDELAAMKTRIPQKSQQIGLFPLDPSSEPVGDIFAYGLPLLTSAGIKEAQARSFLGRMRKHYPDEVILEKIKDCIRANPIQPISWLAAALPPKTSAKATAKTKTGKWEKINLNWRDYSQVDYGSEIKTLRGSP